MKAVRWAAIAFAFCTLAAGLLFKELGAGLIWMSNLAAGYGRLPVTSPQRKLGR